MTFALALALAFAAPPVHRDGAVIEDISFPAAGRDLFPSGQTAAYRICPEKRPRRKPPGVLFVHWYDPPDKTSNRTQFIDEAVTLAQSGVCSLLIETLWSNPDWFPKRDRTKDVAQTEAILRETRHALQFLRTFADPKRLAYVGHDFGAMAGASIAADEPQIKTWALQAGTPQWGNWYLLGWRVEGAEREAIQQRTAHLDATTTLKRAKGNFFFQFGRNDRFVPDAKANEFAAAAPQPAKVAWYGGGHGLDAQARQDRIAWLKQQLRLR